MTRATWRELRWAAIAWRRSDGPRPAGERLLQLLDPDVGVRDGDEVAHDRSVGATRVTPDHPPGVIPRDPGAGDAARHGGGRPARHRAAPERAGAPACRQRRAGGERGRALAMAPRRARAPARARLRALGRLGDRDLDTR